MSNEYSSLWFDKSDSLSNIQLINFKKTKYVNENNVRDFIKNGFTIIKNAVSKDDIDIFLSEIEHKNFQQRNDIYCSYGTKVEQINNMNINTPLTKTLDLYVKLNSASNILCCDAIKEFLKIMFTEKPKLFQSLYFKKGSTQNLHQDPTYVVIDKKPHNLIATWVALEDVHPGSGALEYISGSHNKLFFKYKNNKIHWSLEEDGVDMHNHHLYCLREMAKELTLTQFLPKKGDILFWHAGLVHGGSKITDDTLTRKSIVGHYCPASYYPKYYIYDKNRYISENNDIDIVSLYYSRY